MRKIIFLFFILVGFHVSAQADTNDLCQQLYGRWETYYIQLPFGIDPPNKNEIWIFNENGTLTINGKMSGYKLDEDCSKLYIGSGTKPFSMVFFKDTLYLNKKIMVHEEHILRFKKTKKDD
ncbi:hypothetical protein [Flavobacterium sp. CFS9]